MTSRPLLKAEDVRALLNCGRTFVYEHKAELGAISHGTLLRFDPDAVDAYIEAHRVRPPLAIVESKPAPEMKLPVPDGAISVLTGKPFARPRQAVGR